MANTNAEGQSPTDPTDASIIYRLALGWALILATAGVALAETAARALVTAWRAAR
jgi:hypothetical protein